MVALPATAAMGAAVVIGFRLLGPFMFASWATVTVLAFSGLMLRARTMERARRARLEERRAILMARLAETAGTETHGQSGMGLHGESRMGPSGEGGTGESTPAPPPAQPR